MNVKLLESWSEVGEAQWHRLWATSTVKVPFLTWQWMTCWWAAFGEGSQLKLFRVTDDDDALVGLLPLYEDAHDKSLRLVGGVDVSDYLDLVVKRGCEERVWSALLEHLAAGRATLELHCVPAASPTLTVLPGLAERHGFSLAIEREERCPVIDLPNSWDGYLSSLSGKERHELQRKTRRLTRIVPEVNFRAQRTVEKLDDQMTAFSTLHRKSKRRKARFMDDRMERFFRRIAREFASLGWLCLWVLEVRGDPLAALFCFDDGQTVFLYNSGFDPGYAELAPGIVLTAHAIREAIAGGRQRFDLLRGEEPYKLQLGAKPEDVMRITLAVSNQQLAISTNPRSVTEADG
ncbi:MAG TPA: GNAT family N-acetyltransferase [Methylomirabilota bacterium]|nr:GNAT family N-acetyltransferase [Methylomirabilota bacterium]